MFAIGSIIEWRGPERIRLNRFGDERPLMYGEKFFVHTIIATDSEFARSRGLIEEHIILLRADGSKTYIYDTEYHWCVRL
jgi:hypothetical protein